MDNIRPLLSISILSSGRIETIERCLSSLDAIRAAIPTEVIVVDTDPNNREDVHRVLERYADRITRFEWCDDFAAARNAGLEECSGKWFLFIDDDEWIINSSPVIEWLKSDEACEYLSVDLGIANYTDAACTKYIPSYVSRLFRMDDGVKFKGMIHEYPDVFDGRVKLLSDTIIGHSGYIYQNGNTKDAHIDRNIRILKKQIDVSPKEMRWRQQLVNEYEQNGELEKAITSCEEALDMFAVQKSTDKGWIKGYFVCERLRLERLSKDYFAEKAIYEDIAEERDYGEVCNAYLDSEAAFLYFKSGEYERAVSFANSYLSIYEDSSDNDELYRQKIHFLEETFTVQVRLKVICVLIDSDIHMGRWSSFERYFDEINWESDSGFDFSWFGEDCLVLTAMIEYDKHMKHMYSVFWQSSVMRPYIRRILDSAGKQKDIGYWRVVYALVSATGNAFDAPWDLVVVLGEHREDVIVDYSDVFAKMLDRTNPMLYGQDIWVILFDNIPDIVECINSSSFMKWRRNIDNSVKELQPELLLFFMDRFKKLYDDYDSYFLLYLLFRYGTKLLEQTEHDDYKILKGKISRIFNYVKSYYNVICKDITEYENIEILPDEYRLALKWDELFLLDESDYKTAMVIIKTMLGVMPEMDGVINTYAHLYGDEAKKQLQSPEDEMDQLTKQLYHKVEEMKAAGMIQEAADLEVQIKNALSIMPKKES